MIHMRIHSVEKSNKCNQCNLAFHHAGNLKNHLKTHSGEKDYKCNKCHYKASRADHLKTHMKGHMRLYKCENCHSTFNIDSEMRSHLKTHSDDKLPAKLKVQRQTYPGKSEVTLYDLIQVQKHLIEISGNSPKNNNLYM